MKFFLIKVALDLIIDLLIIGAKYLVQRTDNDIDDEWVEKLERNKDVLKLSVKDAAKTRRK